MTVQKGIWIGAVRGPHLCLVMSGYSAEMAPMAGSQESWPYWAPLPPRTHTDPLLAHSSFFPSWWPQGSHTVQGSKKGRKWSVLEQYHSLHVLLVRASTEHLSTLGQGRGFESTSPWEECQRFDCHFESTTVLLSLFYTRGN